MEKKKSFRLAMERQVNLVDEKKRSKDSPGKRGDSPLHLAARAGNLTKVREMFQKFDENIIKELLSKKNQGGETALYVAAENGHASVVGEFLKHIDIGIASLMANNSYNPFHAAAKQGNLEVLIELLGVFPELIMTTDLYNTTALHTAAAQGHIDVVNLLLDTDSDLAKIARSNGKTVLHTAARIGHLEVVKSLLSKAPSLSFRTDKKGQTALHVAVKGQNVEIVRELIKPDLSVLNLPDKKGNTPLHIATRKSQIQIVRCLIAMEGISVNAVNRSVETPLDIGEKLKIPELYAILKEAGAIHSKDHGKPSAARQLKQTVSNVRKISKKVKKFHISGLNNAINSATVVAVFIASVAFAAIFTVPGQYVEDKVDGYSLGQAHIAKNAAFIVFFLFDSLALYISLAVIVVQTSIVVIELKAKKQLLLVVNKLMWLACLFISIAFVSLTYVVVGRQERWLAVCATVIGGTIMLATIGSMCYCVVQQKME